MDSIEALKIFYDKATDFAKSSEPLLPHAAKLKQTPEWEAFKQILLTKIAKESIDYINKSIEPSELKRGQIQGMSFVIDLVETGISAAMEKKKEILLRKSQKDNHLTEKQV